MQDLTRRLVSSNPGSGFEEGWWQIQHARAGGEDIANHVRIGTQGKQAGSVNPCVPGLARKMTASM
jgi:hypothetical protein